MSRLSSGGAQSVWKIMLHGWEAESGPYDRAICGDLNDRIWEKESLYHRAPTSTVVPIAGKGHKYKLAPDFAKSQIWLPFKDFEEYYREQ